MAGERDRAEGAWDETKGKVKEAAGDVTDDHELEAEGKRDQAKGHAEKALGHAKDATESVREGVEDATR